jgi:hypothetical protein
MTEDIPPCGFPIEPDRSFVCGPNYISEFKRMTLAQCTQGLIFPVCEADAELKDIAGYFTRRGTHHAVLKYPAFDITPSGASFRFDSKLNTLKRGRYLFTVKHKDCQVCAEIEIDITKSCVVKDIMPTLVKALAPLPKIDAPQGATPMYDAISTLNIELCSPLIEGQATLPISITDAAALCAIVLCKPVELVISDGVNREIVEFSGCAGGIPALSRAKAGTAQAKFPKGSSVSFYWTQANTVRAMGGC